MMNARQIQLLRFIEEHIDQFGLAPNYEEMRDALGYRSKSIIHRHVHALERCGMLRREPLKARGIELIRSRPDITITIGEDGRAKVLVGGRVTPAWLARHGSAVRAALEARFVAVKHPVRIGV